MTGGGCLMGIGYHLQKYSVIFGTKFKDWIRVRDCQRCGRHDAEHNG
jgi:hypothetical protein